MIEFNHLILVYLVIILNIYFVLIPGKVFELRSPRESIKIILRYIENNLKRFSRELILENSLEYFRREI